MLTTLEVEQILAIARTHSGPYRQSSSTVLGCSRAVPYVSLAGWLWLVSQSLMLVPVAGAPSALFYLQLRYTLPLGHP